MAHQGVFGGMWNAALAGAFGTIISAILFIILVAIGGRALMGTLGGLNGFTVYGISTIFSVIDAIIKYMIVMGITGAIGGYIRGKDNKN